MQYIQRIIRVMIITIFTALCLTSATDFADADASRTVPMAQEDIESIDVRLGPLCFSVTSSGSEIASCLSGIVRLNGDAIKGAEVIIVTQDHKYVALTDKQDGQLGNDPYYQLGLPGVEPGHALTITAQYGDRQWTENYIAKLGSQRVDIVLSGTSPDEGYALKKTLWGQGESGLLQGPHGIAINSKDHIYVVDRQNQRIQVFDQVGQPVILNNGTNTWGRLGNGDGEFFSPFGIAIDLRDNVYIADTGNHRIQKFSANGTFIAEWGSFGTDLGEFYRPEGIAIDSEGWIYVADSGNHRIQKFYPTGTDLDINFGNQGSIGNMGSGEGEFRYPTALVMDSQENLYVVDYQNHRVQKFDGTGMFLNEFGSYGGCGDPNGCQAGDFDLPDGITIDDEGNVYVSDTNHRVQKFDSHGNWLSGFGSSGTTDGRFQYPKGLAIDYEGNLYVADKFNNRIQKFDQKFIWTAAWGDQGDNSEQLVEPSGMAEDGDGNLYIADRDENRIQIFNSKGQWVQNIGDDADSVQFDGPQDVAIDKDGNIYVVESGSHRIQKLDSAGNLLHSWGGKGNKNGEFHTPVALAIDQEDYIYVIDKDNHRIQKFNTDGNYILKLDGGSIGGDSPEDKFNSLNDIAIGPNGTIYVADTANHRIQTFNPQGGYERTLGSYGKENGQFSNLTGIDVDENGNIYAVDSTTRIQKFDSTGQHIVTWGKASIQNNGTVVAPTLNQLTCLQSDCSLRLTLGNDESVYVTDPENNRVQIIVAETTVRPPTVWINWIKDAVLEYDSILQINAMTADEDTKVEWHSDIDGYLTDAKELAIPVDQLTVGTHVISVRTVDDGNQQSSDSITIYIPGPPDEGVVWTLLLYFSADYNDGGSLEQRFNKVIEEFRENFNNPAVRIAIQIDGQGAHDTRRFLLEPGNPVNYTMLHVGEANMDEPDELAKFIRWGQEAFPAENYYLSIAGHGHAIQGIAWDNASRSDHESPNSLRLTVKEIGNALDEPDIDIITILHLDASSMNLVETAYEFKDKIEILISSQWLSWDYFDYVSYVNAFSSKSNPESVTEEIVEAYRKRVDRDYPYTISALDISNSEVVLEAIDNLAAELAAYIESNPNERQLIEQIREQTRTFDSDGNYQNTPTDMYVDLIVWARKLQTDLDVPAIQSRARDLIDILEGQFILFNEESSGSLPGHIGGIFVDNSGAYGLSIFYPINQRSMLFERYMKHEFFSFTEAPINQNWPRFLSVASEPCIEVEGCIHEDPPPPLPPLSDISDFLPMTATSASTSTPTETSMPPTATPSPTSTETSTPTPVNTWTPTPTSSATSTETSTPTHTDTLVPTPTPTYTPSVDPIPVLDTHCHEALPAVGVQLPNCLIGLVYINGQPADNITVQIQSQDGRADTTQTRIHLGREKRPYYSFDLGKLEIDKGESFEVIIEHNGQSYKVEYIAQPGLQQLDLVIPSADQTRPIANIRHQSSQILYEDQTLILDGIGLLGITNTTVTGYRWSSDRQGELGGAPMLELPADNLEAGSHTITLQVQDSEGNWSAPTETTLDVNISGEATWTILLYLSADFYDGHKMHEIFQETLKHMSEKLNTNAIQIVAQVDGPRKNDTKHWLIQNGRVVDKGFCFNVQCESAADAPDSLVDFLHWAQAAVPAEHYYLVIADHGQGIQGTAWDSTSDLVDDGIQNNSAYLTIRELGNALNNPDVQPIDILHLDACSMNLLETAFELHEKVDVLISSQYLAWNYFPYDQYLPFFSDPRRTPQEIAERIVQHYGDRAESDNIPFTISALDMTQGPAVFATVNQFIDQLLTLMEGGQLDEQTLKTVREAVQTFDSNDNQVNDRSDYYIDLFDWSTQLTSVLDDRELKGQAINLTRDLFNFVIENRAGSYTLPSTYGSGQYLDLNRANGLSIFYPMDYNTRPYAEYINHELFSFTAQSPWPKFLQAIGGTVQSAANLEPFPGPLGHLDIQPPQVIYLPVIMR